MQAAGPPADPAQAPVRAAGEGVDPGDHVFVANVDGDRVDVAPVGRGDDRVGGSFAGRFAAAPARSGRRADTARRAERPGQRVAVEEGDRRVDEAAHVEVGAVGREGERVRTDQALARLAGRFQAVLDRALGRARRRRQRPGRRVAGEDDDASPAGDVDVPPIRADHRFARPVQRPIFRASIPPARREAPFGTRLLGQRSSRRITVEDVDRIAFQRFRVRLADQVDVLAVGAHRRRPFGPRDRPSHRAAAFALQRHAPRRPRQLHRRRRLGRPGAERQHQQHRPHQHPDPHAG